MDPQGYAIVLDSTGHFVLRYFPDVNRPGVYMEVTRSFNYDGIMRALLQDRVMRGMEAEYWIS